MWMPIETAPKDGSQYLIFEPRHGRRLVVRWSEPGAKVVVPWTGKPLPAAFAATHWMEINPPKSGGKEVTKAEKICVNSTRMDYTKTLPITVQNIMLEHMQRVGLSLEKANDALVGIASEMRQWDFHATDTTET